MDKQHRSCIMKHHPTFHRFLSVKTLLYTGIAFCICIIGCLYYCNHLVKQAAEHKIYNTTTEIPHRNTALLLGTSPKLRNGEDNLYFLYRIQATADLYKAGKISYILISGDNSRSNYNEPESMKQALIRLGIPSKVIYLDYAGLRTLDSVVRAKKIFGQNSITIISQKFHNERAIFIAQAYGIDAIGYNAQNVSRLFGLKTRLREYFARVKMCIDILTHKQPRFLGEKIEIPVAP